MRQPSSKSAQGGVALIEAMVAIFIFSVGVLAVIGMQAVSIRTSSDAKYRADAAYLADQLIGRMWADQGNLAQYATGAANCAAAASAANYANAATWLNTVASTLPGAATTRQRVQVDTSGTPPINQVTVTVCWETGPGTGTYHNHVITTRINNNG